MPPHRDEDESDGSKDTCNCSSSSSSNRRDTFSRRFRRFFLIDAISMWIYNRSCSCADECTRWKTLLREVVTEATDWPHCGCSRCRSTNGNTPSRQVSLIGRSRVLHLISSISFSFFFCCHSNQYPHHRFSSGCFWNCYYFIRWWRWWWSCESDHKLSEMINLRFCTASPTCATVPVVNDVYLSDNINETLLCLCYEREHGLCVVTRLDSHLDWLTLWNVLFCPFSQFVFLLLTSVWFLSSAAFAARCILRAFRFIVSFDLESFNCFF